MVRSSGAEQVLLSVPVVRLLLVRLDSESHDLLDDLPPLRIA